MSSQVTRCLSRLRVTPAWRLLPREQLDLGWRGGQEKAARGDLGLVGPSRKAQGVAFPEHRPGSALVTLPVSGRPLGGTVANSGWIGKKDEIFEAGTWGLNVNMFLLLAVPYKGQEADKGHVLVKGQGPSGGQYPAKGKGPVKTHGPHQVGTKPGTCPKTLIRCAMLNPPNACLRDSECKGSKKCCEGSCGKACMTPH